MLRLSCSQVTVRSWKFRLVLFLAIVCHSFLGLHAQYITHGPVIGAVTSTSCKIYLRTASPAELKLQWNDSSFVTGYTDTTRDKSVILQLSNLLPDTKYSFNVFVNGKQDTVKGSFRTFPKEGQRGDYTFVTGSCQETKNMKVFDVIPLQQPYFLMHTGDYTYPDYQIKPDYSNTMDTVAISYQRRYDEKVMKQMLYNVPVDYLFDDNDYVGGNGGRYCKNDMRSWTDHGKVKTEFIVKPFPPHWRRNVIKGYDEFFPHYDMPDTSEGIFHSFKLGNAEFFVIDRNSDKEMPNAAPFVYDSTKHKWKYIPPPGYVQFGKKQMDWLKKSLLESKADWKFIVAGGPLNGACKKLIDGGMKLQKLHYKNWYGIHIASGFSSYWAGYPEERDDFMKFVKDNNLKNLIVISGDTHHNVMDDGKNAGLPEMNASGMSVETTALAHYLKLIGNATGTFRMGKIWNQGGNGLKGEKSKNAFGKVRIVKDEYVELSIIDEDNHVVSSFKVPHQK
jgi:alkaline phosphatase D